jgi:HlyD family secretion protein
MPENVTRNKRIGAGAIKVIGVLGLVAVIAVVVVWLRVIKGSGEATQENATFAARRGPLTINVLESGTVRAKDQIVIKNEVEGRAAIITLVDEGTQIKKGDLLVELDSSKLKDQLVDQEISVQNGDASRIEAEENLAVVQNQGESDVAKAELTLQFAKQDLQQYTEPNGLYENEVKQTQATISLRQEELTRARDSNDWSGRLYREKYLSETEYLADQLGLRRAQLEMERSSNDLRILREYTYKRRIAELESEVEQAEMAMERTQGQARANNTQAEARLKARTAEYKRQVSKQKKIEDQISKCRIIAPADGLVIYATSANRSMFNMGKEPLDEGVQVHERQELIHLPQTQSVLAEVDVHEANLRKIKPGLPAIVTLDALPGERFFGTVRTIAPLPNAGMPWLADVKLYKSEVDLEADSTQLRSGMTCKAEIVIAQHDDAVYVPVQTVINVGGNPTVYVLEDGAPVARTVKTGLDNNRMICIEEGLEEGELVLMKPPLDAGATEPAAASAPTGAEPNDANAVATGLSGDMEEKVRAQLKTAAQSPPPGRGGPGAGQGQDPGDMRQPSPEEIKEMQEKMKRVMDSLSDEEKEQLKTMSPQERGEFFKKKLEEVE